MIDLSSCLITNKFMPFNNLLAGQSFNEFFLYLSPVLKNGKFLLIIKEHS